MTFPSTGPGQTAYVGPFRPQSTRPTPPARAGGPCRAFWAIHWWDGKRMTITGVGLGQPGLATALATAGAMIERITGHPPTPDLGQPTLPPLPAPGTINHGCASVSASPRPVQRCTARAAAATRAIVVPEPISRGMEGGIAGPIGRKALQTKPFPRRAGSEWGTEKPAVVHAHLGNRRCLFAGCFERERRDSNPRPPA